MATSLGKQATYRFFRMFQDGETCKPSRGLTQEILTLPTGPVETNQVWYAGSRPGVRGGLCDTRAVAGNWMTPALAQSAVVPDFETAGRPRGAVNDRFPCADGRLRSEMNFLELDSVFY